MLASCNKNPSLIMKKYKPMYIIGSGTFSKIICIENIFTGQKYAMKLENKHSELSLLLREANLYNILKDISGIPKLLWFGTDSKYRFVILPLYTNNLSSMYVKTISDLLQLGNKILSIVEQLHLKGYIHRDIKPENIMFNEEGTLHIIDFGMCTSFYEKKVNSLDGVEIHVKQKYTSNIIGTPNYISTNIHNLVCPSRRDDVIAVLYVLLNLFWGGTLPWKLSTIDMMKIYKEQLLALDGYTILKSTTGVNTFEIPQSYRSGKIPESIYKMLKMSSELSYEDKPIFYFL